MCGRCGSLSRKAATENPWQLFVRHHRIGEIIPVTVVKIVSFGVFVRELGTRAGEWFSDRHLRPQHQVVHLDAIPYSRMVRLETTTRFAVVTSFSSHVNRAECSQRPGNVLQSSMQS